MESNLSAFEQILAGINKEGKFTASVLTSEDGLTIAAVPHDSQYDSDTVAAMVSQVREFIHQTQSRLGLGDIDEVSMVITDRSRLVCRYFEASGQRFILTVIAPPDTTYRRLSGRAVREIREAWAS
jgi:predicted regulator of Ras-like GTPase activity (Roadblock/LC7/MglB family)